MGVVCGEDLRVSVTFLLADVEAPGASHARQVKGQRPDEYNYRPLLDVRGAGIRLTTLWPCFHDASCLA